MCPPHGQPGGFSAQQRSRPSGKGGRGLQAQCDGQHRQHRIRTAAVASCTLLGHSVIDSATTGAGSVLALPQAAA